MKDSTAQEIAYSTGFDSYSSFSNDLSHARLELRSIGRFDPKEDIWLFYPDKINSFLESNGITNKKLASFRPFIVQASTILQFVNYGLDVFQMVIDKCLELDNKNI